MVNGWFSGFGFNSFEKNITKLEVTLLSKSELKPPQNGLKMVL